MAIRAVTLVAATVGALVLCGVTAGPVLAQVDSRDGIALQNQILEMRRDIQQLRNDPSRAPAPSYGGALGNTGRNAPASNASSEITTQLLDRVDRLEDSVRRLNGRLDEADNARQQQGADLAKQLADLQFKIDNGASASSPRPATSASASSQSPTPLGTLPLLPPPIATPALVKRTPELALQEGNAALARRDYTVAEASAREILAGKKDSPRAYDAQFLLAQAMMGQRNYPQAAVGYSDAYDRNKQGAHAQDSLVGLAKSLTTINEKRSACAALDTLRTQFPTPRADIAPQALALRSTAGCH